MGRTSNGKPKFLFKRGNDLWNRRAKHGRDKLFSTPKLMLEAACEYFQSCIDNPLITTEWKVVDKELVNVKTEHTPPFTWIGLCIFLDCGEAYFREFQRNKDRCTPDFMTVIEKIRHIIYTQKFEGASVGKYNANIISRELGLADKIQNENINYNSAPLDKEELKNISKQLDDDV